MDESSKAHLSQTGAEVRLAIRTAAHNAKLGDPVASKRRREADCARIDVWLGALFETACEVVLGPAPTAHGDAREGIALAAVGSLGRKDLGPESDLDLVLLHSGKQLSDTQLRELCDAMWYPIWDATFSLDHAVRTPAQSLQAARDDVTAAVALLEIRRIAGSAALVDLVRDDAHQSWRSTARKHIDRLSVSMLERSESVGELAYLSEPDLKSSRGGLRDVVNLKALTATWLADRPHGDVDGANDLLLEVRDAIQVVTGRATTRLLRADCHAVAVKCRLADPADLPGDASDELLQQLAGAARTVKFALESTARRARQASPAGRRHSFGLGVSRRPALNQVGLGLVEHDGEVSLGPHLVNSRDPWLGLRVSATAARLNLVISPATLQRISALPAMPEPWTAEARERFFELMGSGRNQVSVWESLDQWGILTQWFPEWHGVRNRPQRSAIHRFTVDRHSIETVVHASQSLRSVNRPDVLLFAALVHDIGKRKGQRDHSVEGAPFARAMAQRVGFATEDVQVIELLVREHLTLTDLATRRDPQDPATFAALSDAVDGRIDVLDLLRSLTEADARAASQPAWSTWRAQLIDALYSRTRRRLGAAAVETGVRDEPVATTQLETHEYQPFVSVRESGLAAVQVNAITLAGALTTDTSGPPEPLQPGLFCVTMCAPLRRATFAAMSAVLTNTRMTVKSAQIRTVESVVVNTWWVEAFAGVPHEAELLRALESNLVAFAAEFAAQFATDIAPAGGAAPDISTTATNGALDPGRRTAADYLPPVIRHLADASAGATVIDVRATDRRGLLTDLARVILRNNIDLRSALATTIAAQAIDVFYLTEPNGDLLDNSRVAELISDLMHAAT